MSGGLLATSVAGVMSVNRQSNDVPTDLRKGNHPLHNTVRGG